MSALTEAVQDVVEVVEIIVAVLHDGPVAHGVVEPAVGVCHGACAGQGDKGAEGTVTTQPVTSTEGRMFKETMSDQGTPSWPHLASCPAPSSHLPPGLPSLSASTGHVSAPGRPPSWAALRRHWAPPGICS